MLNRGKSNQESRKRTGWNRHSGHFQDPTIEWIPCLYSKERGKELEIIPDSFLANHFKESLQNDILSHSSGVFN